MGPGGAQGGLSHKEMAALIKNRDGKPLSTTYLNYLEHDRNKSPICSINWPRCLSRRSWAQRSERFLAIAVSRPLPDCGPSAVVVLWLARDRYCSIDRTSRLLSSEVIWASGSRPSAKLAAVYKRTFLREKRLQSVASNNQLTSVAFNQVLALKASEILGYPRARGTH